MVDAKTDAARAIDGANDADLVPQSAGPTPVAECLRQLAADHLVHAWDLATAAGANLRLDDDLIAAVTTWFAGMEQVYRSPRSSTCGDSR